MNSPGGAGNLDADFASDSVMVIADAVNQCDWLYTMYTPIHEILRGK